eukprot:7933349-Pyramimonas_sp.AAC.1
MGRLRQAGWRASRAKLSEVYRNPSPPPAWARRSPRWREDSSTSQGGSRPSESKIVLGRAANPKNCIGHSAVGPKTRLGWQNYPVDFAQKYPVDFTVDC